ncbi:unnamed protein product [Paramecium primaurelia]|uniref:Transmembrane protein n=1 Tax=Paramecium primaurelia TaxID=5886 RepID=A0A8S1K583_PARPR|nr:unnamed protein product [Paramecium primaurelia]
MRVVIVLLICLVFCQGIPVHKRFLQLEDQDNDVQYTSENLQVVVDEKSQNKDVQILAVQDSDLMINQLEPSEKLEQQQSLDDETPLNSAYFEDDYNNNEIIQDASQNIVEDLKLIGQLDNNNIIDENHQIIDTQQNITDENENYASDTMNVNDEIQQEIIDQQNVQDKNNNEDNYYNDSIENNDTLQVSDTISQQFIAQSNDVPDLTYMDQDQIAQQFTQSQYEVQTNQIEQTNQQDQTIIIDNQLQKDENQVQPKIIVVEDQSQMKSDDSSPKQVNIQQEISSEDPNNINNVQEEQISQCIELYSQCYYKGEFMKACNDLGQMKDFPYEIKSLKIPYGTTLTIYDHPNYEGERHTFSKNEECLENVIVLTQITF